MHELVLDTSLREASALVGLGHEALRKFVNGTTERPHQRSLRSMGRLLAARRARAGAGLAEPRTETPSAPHLKLLFPTELDAALGQVKALFDDWREGRPPPPLAAEVERWMATRLREEHAADPRAPVRARSRR